jgi:hypothetical protein
MIINPIFTLKATTFTLAGVAAAIFLVDPTVKVAIVGAIPATISAFMWGWVNHAKISTVEVNTNSTLTLLREQVKTLVDENKAVSSRADRAEARTEGDQSREDRKTKGE